MKTIFTVLFYLALGVCAVYAATIYTVVLAAIVVLAAVIWLAVAIVRALHPESIPVTGRRK